MPTLVCYDIGSNALRARMGKKILEYGLERINRSVYLGAPDERELAELESLLRGLMAGRAGSEDSLIIIPVTARQVMLMTVIGKNDFEPEELSGDLDTLIF